MVKSRWPLSIVLCLTVPVALAAWLLPTAHESAPAFPPPRPNAEWPSGSDVDAVRADALRRARVWMPPAAAAADLASNPPDPNGALSEPIVRCRYLDSAPHGTTAKFDCELPDGEVVKVKYGHTGEIHAEVAASRLLSALGFGADRMYLVPRLRCYGCVRTPFYTNWALDRLDARKLLSGSLPEDRYVDFEWPAVERRFDGLRIEAGDRKGWSWFELDDVDTARGASREERDALRLAAMLLAHWDNKSENQRLVCLAPGSKPASCPRPFALIQDLGATFGPNKVDLEHWKAALIWADRDRCIVSMKPLPYQGGTFRETAISEAGRQLIARQLFTLSERQLIALFTSARFREFAGSKDGDERAWAMAFLDKVRQIASGAPCPA